MPIDTFIANARHDLDRKAPRHIIDVALADALVRLERLAEASARTASCCRESAQLLVDRANGLSRDPVEAQTQREHIVARIAVATRHAQAANGVCEVLGEPHLYVTRHRHDIAPTSGHTTVNHWTLERKEQS